MAVIRGKHLCAVGQEALAALVTDPLVKLRDNQKREQSFFVTLLTDEELAEISTNYCDNLRTCSTGGANCCEHFTTMAAHFGDSNRFIDLGFGIAESDGAVAVFRILCWPEVALWRESMGLPWVDCHVELGLNENNVDIGVWGISGLRSRVGPPSSTQQVSHVLAELQQVIKAGSTAKCLQSLLELALDASAGNTGNTLLARQLLCKVCVTSKDYKAAVLHATAGLDDSSAFTDSETQNRLLWFRAVSQYHLGNTRAALDDLLVIQGQARNFSDTQLEQLHRAVIRFRRHLGQTATGQFFKFPRTPHLFDVGGNAVTRDDLLVGDPDFWIGSGRIVAVEEKIDGANLGVSCGTHYELQFQNRSHYINEESHAQWVGLDHWAKEFGSMVSTILEPERRVLFGEWCTTVHSLEYTRLPSHFIAFDMYDRVTKRWYTRAQLHKILEPTGIPVAPILAFQQIRTRDELIAMLETPSQFRSQGATLEGVYLRHEADDGQVYRCKLVRPDFVQGITSHWMSCGLRKNTIVFNRESV